LPFRYHWYVPLPPFVAVAVKVTLSPGQIEPEGLATIFTVGAIKGLMVVVRVLEVAVLGEIQGPTAFNSTTYILSPAARVVVEYVEFVAPPIGLPFRYHW